MGLVLLVIGSGLLTSRAYTLTLGTGAVLVAIGAIMMRSQFFPRRLQPFTTTKPNSR
jgi:hypothetical protein